MSYCVGSDMSCKDMILDSVSVANLDEVNLSDMVMSGVIFPEFTWLRPAPIPMKGSILRLQALQKFNHIKHLRGYDLVLLCI